MFQFSAGITEGRMVSWVSTWRHSVTLVCRQWIVCLVWIDRAMLGVPHYCENPHADFNELFFFFSRNQHLFLLCHPRPCWWVSVMSASVGIPSRIMGPCSRTIGSGCATRPSNQLWSDVMSSPPLCSQRTLQHTGGILRYLLKEKKKTSPKTQVWSNTIIFSLKFSQLSLERYTENSCGLQQILLVTVKLLQMKQTNIFLMNGISLMLF